MGIRSTSPTADVDIVGALHSGSSPSLGAPTFRAIVVASAPPSFSPVINVASIKTHVPICLDFKVSNYSKWRNFFTVFLSKFGLLHHITAPPTDPKDVKWRQQVFGVVSWLYGSISEKILDIIMELDQLARDVWSRIKDLLHETKIVVLSSLRPNYTALSKVTCSSPPIATS